MHAVLLSRLGKDVLDRAGVSLTRDTLADEIACKTVGILREVTDPEQAYRVLAERTRKARKSRTAPQARTTPQALAVRSEMTYT